MRDSRSLDAWMRWEAERLNAGFVPRPRPLRVLLGPSPPKLETREGDEVVVEPGVLRRLAAACSEEEKDRLRIPITIHFSSDSEDSAYVADETAAAVLRRLEGWGEAFPHRDGKTWLPNSLAVDLLLRYGNAIQRLHL